MTQVERVLEATPDVVTALAHLIPQLSSSAEPVTEPVVASLVSDPAIALFVARSNDAIIGTLTVATFRTATGVRAWIEDVVVDAGARGLGAGEALTKAGIDYAREVGAISVDLTSRPSRTEANRLYVRVGFVQRETNVYRFSLGD